ncbi:MAG: hypothetical protein WC813_00250 [Patescibacteria group bacterium]
MLLFDSRKPRVVLPVVFTPPENGPHPRSAYPYDPHVLCVEVLPNRLFVVSKTEAAYVPAGAIIMVDDAETAAWRSVEDRADAFRVNLYQDGLLSLKNGLQAMNAEKYAFVSDCREAVDEYCADLVRGSAEVRIMVEDLQDNGLPLRNDAEIKKFRDAAHALRGVSTRPFARFFGASGKLIDQALEIIETGNGTVTDVYGNLSSARATLKAPRLLVQLFKITLLASDARRKEIGIPKKQAQWAFHQINDIRNEFAHLKAALHHSMGVDYVVSFQYGLNHLNAAAQGLDPFHTEERPINMEETYKLLTEAGRTLAGMA